MNSIMHWGIPLLLILSQALIGFYALEATPESLTLSMPFNLEYTLDARLFLVISFVKGGLLVLFYQWALQAFTSLTSPQQGLTQQQVQWLKDDYKLKIQQLEDENRQLKAFNETLERAIEKQS